jgi:tetratricopeptide (TPR) repeat protein/CHAT domain-containing protein
MRVWRSGLGFFLAVVLVAVTVGTTEPARAQSDKRLEALSQRITALRNAGKGAEAIPLAEQQARAIKSRYGENHLRYAAALATLADLLQDAGRGTEAESLLRRALAIEEKSGDNSVIAGRLNRLAELLRTAGRLAEAEPLYRRAFSINERTYGPEHGFNAPLLNNLALVLAATNRRAEAETLHRRALAIAEKALGPAHPEVAIHLSNLADLLRDTDRFSEAEPLMRRALAIDEGSLGPEHPNVAMRLSTLAELLRVTGRFAQAEPLMRRALAIDERTYGPEHRFVGVRLNNLALVLQATNRLAEAEPLFRRALAISEKTYGPEHPEVATNLNNLADLLVTTDRFAEAEPLMRRALAIDERALGPDHHHVALRLGNLAILLSRTNRLGEAEWPFRQAVAIYEKNYGPDHTKVAEALSGLGILMMLSNRATEAEPALRRALAILERSYGPDHVNVAVCLNALGQVLVFSNRHTEAEPLFRRAIAIQEKVYGPEHFNVAASLNNLAILMTGTNRPVEAERLFRRALAINEKSYGPNHTGVAVSLNILAQLILRTRPAEAEPLIRRALAINEKSYGPEHFNVADDLSILAQLVQQANRLAEAEPLMRRALAIYQRSLGPKHFGVANGLNRLAALRGQQGDWTEAAQLYRRAKPIMIAARGQRADSDRSGLAKAQRTQYATELRLSARAVVRAEGGGSDAREEAFELAQWAQRTGAADALSQMSVRFAKGAGPLAQLVRERQDLVARRQAEDKRLLASVGAADAKGVESIRIEIAGIDATLDAMETRLTQEFAGYADLANPKPLTIAAVQALLDTDEALVVFLDVPFSGSVPEETLAWALTRTDARTIRIPLGTWALGGRVADLRCGLDREGQWSWVEEHARWEAVTERCRRLKPEGLAAGEPLPFQLGWAYDLYARLLQPFADLTNGKKLIIVPSGPLTSLPFHALVTAGEVPPPAPQAGAAAGKPKLATLEDYRSAAWLALQQPITVLPSVGSLQALRKLPPTQAKEPYIAFGNPLLDGNPKDIHHKERAKSARTKQSCPLDLESLRQRVATAVKATPGLGTFFRGVSLAALRGQPPLPETADELCAVGKALGAVGREDETVWLGARATEKNLKELSRAGKLARYRVLHFATHGLLAGESEAVLEAEAEPALMLSPPRDGATPAELEEDNGLLMASEAAQLDLDADWVVLSACNTAAGEKGDAEALSGLARAFFYAKARALLVSHWYVDSAASVKLTTGAFAELSARPEIGRAEALRRSMARLITEGTPEEAHPEYWAPFVLVGEGTR